MTEPIRPDPTRISWGQLAGWVGRPGRLRVRLHRRFHHDTNCAVCQYGDRSWWMADTPGYFGPPPVEPVTPEELAAAPRPPMHPTTRPRPEDIEAVHAAVAQAVANELLDALDDEYLGYETWTQIRGVLHRWSLTLPDGTRPDACVVCGKPSREPGDWAFTMRGDAHQECLPVG